MNREKQIEEQVIIEMADDIRRIRESYFGQADYLFAKKMFEDGYHKQKEGAWIISSDGYYPYCSECKHEPKNGVMTDFCPNCGAKMKGGAE